MKIYCHIIILLLSISSFAQRLTLAELHAFASNKNWETTNKSLLSQGWEYFESSKDFEYLDAENYNKITWSFNRNYYDNKATGWLYIFNVEDMPNKIIYRFRKKEYYTLLIKHLSSSGYKLTNEKILDDRVIAYYENPQFFLQINYNKESDFDDDYSYYEKENQTYTVYEIAIYKKGGFFDPNNGLKTDYDEIGNKTAEYTLKNGEFNGVYMAYDSLGRIIESINYINGSKEGGSKIYVNYEDNKRLEISGNYKNNEMHGEWIGSIVSSNYTQEVLHLNFLNGKREGINGEIRDNKIYYQSYKNDELEGKSTEYLILDNQLKLDTINQKVVKISELYYKENKLNGDAKYYDEKGLLIFEGTYLDSLKTGIWKKYDYENKLVEDLNYKNDLLDGKYKLRKIDGNILVQGNYYLDEKIGVWKIYNKSKICNWNNIESYETGSYINGKKEGKWQRFSKDEEILESYIYTDGLLYGEHQTYDNGVVIEVKFFKNNELFKHKFIYNLNNYKSFTFSKKDNEYIICNVEINEENTKKTLNYLFVTKNQFIDPIYTVQDFESSNSKFLNGYYEEYENEKIKVYGSYKLNKKIGKWEEYYYDQDVFLTLTYNENGELIHEYYYDLKKKNSFNGEMIYNNSQSNLIEERRIRDGLRNGSTKYKNSDDKLVKKESYKDGILKVD